MKLGQRGSASGVTLAIIAIIISGVALAISWLAYNRTGDDLSNRISREVNDAAEQIDANKAANEAQQGAQDVQQGVNQGAQEVQENTTPNDNTSTQQ